ncbi:sugar phosphate isomerase/epimerase [Natronospirillum operosum]|uniref:Sugar phosphate isomerase/epimerase n=1 Tax=Natronospirillum operosum TaxID=2759953 RepID=A0A4Z0W993_9GAMM|nr:sugar phosphate isomerase/epimerase [Natronospirillum operosum]TGG95179.1 sugar phosphate isomerase/epimerase [Natronospirillum operosum]
MSLLVFQSLWAMENSNPEGTTPPRDEALARIRTAGFAGVTDHLWQREHARALSREAAAEGLLIEGQCFPATIDDLQPTLEHAAESGQCRHITIQADFRTRDLQQATAILEGWQRLAEQAPCPVLLETHRNRITDDLFFTLDLLRELPDLRLVGDLSHYVAGHEIALAWPDTPGVDLSIEQLQQVMQHCHAWHGRVASCEQVQIPISFAQHRPWLEAFRQLWQYGFAVWRARAAPGEDMVFTCELGTVPYAITGPDGLDITDRWAESLQLKALAEEIWSVA